MELLDHFHPPLGTVRHWESFHSRWAAAIADALNRDLLPPGYFAEVQVHVGSRVEVDVGTFEHESASVEKSRSTGVTTATLDARPWSPPAPAMRMPAIFPDSLEVLIVSTEAGPTLVAAVELVSPGNKDRSENRTAFAAKCSSYLQQRIGLMLVDIVTSRRANLHNEVVRILDASDQFLTAPDPLYATAYRPVRRADTEEIEVWTEILEVGRELPTLPLALDKGIVVPVDLGAAYTEACESSRLP